MNFLGVEDVNVPRFERTWIATNRILFKERIRATIDVEGTHEISTHGTGTHVWSGVYGLRRRAGRPGCQIRRLQRVISAVTITLCEWQLQYVGSLLKVWARLYMFCALNEINLGLVIVITTNKRRRDIKIMFIALRFPIRLCSQLVFMSAWSDKLILL